MKKAEPVYQSITEFLRKPFGVDSHEKNFEYDKLYREFKNSKKIKLIGYTVIEDAYYLHLTVPSESKEDEGKVYDVVLRFFPENDSIKKEHSLNNYKIQFFSNSPGFMYRYAVLYKKHGYLITEMYEKMDPDFIDKLPDKTNPNMDLSYDKSIYFVCKFLTDWQFRYLSKFGVLLQHKKSPSNFFKGISSFKNMKIDDAIRKAEKQAEKDLDKTKRNPDKMIRDIRGKDNEHGNILPKKSLVTKARTIMAKDTARSITKSKVIKPKAKKSKIRGTRHTSIHL